MQLPKPPHRSGLLLFLSRGRAGPGPPSRRLIRGIEICDILSLYFLIYSIKIDEKTFMIVIEFRGVRGETRPRGDQTLYVRRLACRQIGDSYRQIPEFSDIAHTGSSTSGADKKRGQMNNPHTPCLSSAAAALELVFFEPPRPGACL